LPPLVKVVAVLLDVAGEVQLMFTAQAGGCVGIAPLQVFDDVHMVADRLLGAVLVVLKLLGYISISWLWVLAPFWKCVPTKCPSCSSTDR
jgi:phosphatidylglycerophosphatase A